MVSLCSGQWTFCHVALMIQRRWCSIVRQSQAEKVLVEKRLCIEAHLLIIRNYFHLDVFNLFYKGFSKGFVIISVSDITSCSDVQLSVLGDTVTN